MSQATRGGSEEIWVARSSPWQTTCYVGAPGGKPKGGGVGLGKYAGGTGVGSKPEECSFRFLFSTLTGNILKFFRRKKIEKEKKRGRVRGEGEKGKNTKRGEGGQSSQGRTKDCLKTFLV